ncbi:DUF1513 domain-containing protein [Sinisalibacter lacisalsi]|uniref:DUF1513 domain-containing protein n=1 Tax=Sinisalibacter lacisalsi TaxID=1526570 RepID=A0ABQ1QE30_9RHOB|nr:DUF1513 domain-containing protein [Sinisalibacter lacisalsi]GGD23157.1 hypothetical protein GCM10011358_04610 [Sinisalibacter lacisalsi]
MTTRRNFLASLVAVTASPRLGWAAVGSPAYIAAAQLPDGVHVLVGLDLAGAETFRVPLPARGHAGAAHPAQAEAVVFARRPGYFALVIDAGTGRVLHELMPPKGHQFNGHGVYIDGGATLVTVEQMAEGSAGRIGLWDVASGYTRIDGFATHGIGPHDVRLMPDGRTLVVANGGIETDPTDRTKLNLDTMCPNLAYLGAGGDLLEKVELDQELAQNSIRHLAVASDGRVGFAMQWEGEPGMGWPLLGLHRRGERPVLAEAPLADELAMKGYAGSVAFSADESEIAITSPRGGRLNRFAPDGRFVAAEAREDVCGIAPHPDGFIASDGLGGLIALGCEGARPLARHECAWDNHIVPL